MATLIVSCCCCCCCCYVCTGNFGGCQTCLFYWRLKASTNRNTHTHARTRLPTHTCKLSMYTHTHSYSHSLTYTHAQVLNFSSCASTSHLANVSNGTEQRVRQTQPPQRANCICRVLGIWRRGADVKHTLTRALSFTLSVPRGYAAAEVQWEREQAPASLPKALTIECASAAPRTRALSRDKCLFTFLLLLYEIPTSLGTRLSHLLSFSPSRRSRSFAQSATSSSALNGNAK